MRVGSHAQAEPPKIDNQLLGGVPSGLESAQTYQSALGVGLAGTAFDEPGMLVGRVRDDQIDHHPDAEAMGLCDQRVEIDKRAEDRIDVFV
jgi:hypothetical protein